MRSIKASIISRSGSRFKIFIEKCVKPSTTYSLDISRYRIFPRLSTPEKSIHLREPSKWRAFSTTPSKSLAPPRACNPLECKARRVRRGCCATKSPKAPPPAGERPPGTLGFLGHHQHGGKPKCAFFGGCLVVKFQNGDVLLKHVGTISEMQKSQNVCFFFERDFHQYAPVHWHKFSTLFQNVSMHLFCVNFQPWVCLEAVKGR